MWDVLTREADTVSQGSSLLPLPHRYIVPGGRFRAIFYWDSYFTMLGLKESGRVDLIEDMVKNFAHLIMTYGFIPNGNRSYYMTRSQPPMFAHMVALLASIKGDAVYRTYLSALVKEYDFWMHGSTHDAAFKHNKTNTAEHVVRMPDGEILNRFFDSADTPREEGFAEDVEAARHVENPKEFYRNMRAGAESGWDYSSRWFEEGGSRDTIRIIDIVPVDLNALMMMVEEIIATAYQSAGKTAQAEKMQGKAEARAQALQKYFWNEERGWYCDYLLHEKKQSSSLSLAGMFPLFAGIATQEQADATTTTLMQQFLRPGGLATTLVTSGEQWDAPNGWAPLHYVAVIGLERYGHTEHAKDIAQRWCKLNIAAFETTGALLEKYNVEDQNALATGGEYALQDGFGWTNGVLLSLMNRYGIEETSIPSPVTETTAVTA
jgi:alpha,alpha-trehalase